MIGGGVLLLLFKQIGWNGLLPCVALFVIAALLPLFFNKDIRIQPKEAHERAKKADVIYFFARRSIWKQMRGGECTFSHTNSCISGRSTVCESGC